MFASYDAYRTAHNALAFLPPDAPMKETSLLAMTAVEEMLNDRMIWTELQHYQEHKTLLGNHPRREGLSEMERIQRNVRLRPYATSQERRE